MWRLRAPLLALLLMQVILLASSGVTATKKPLGKQETCNMKNHMIEYLRNNGVQIYERPQISSAYCNTEWGVYGTCCEPGLLQVQITEKVRQNELSLQAVVNEISSVGLHLRRFWIAQNKKNSPSKKKKPSANSHATRNGVTFASAQTPNNNKEENQLKAALSQIAGDIKKANTKRVANQQKCVAKINSVISKSACSICSGRSDDFFNKDGKLKMSQELCRNVLEGCSTAWIEMVKLVKQVKDYTHIVRKLRHFSDLGGTLEEKGFTMNLDSFITNRNLIPILEACDQEGLNDCSFEHVAGLCEQFIHIQAPTYIESSQSQINQLLTNYLSTKMTLNDTLPMLTSLTSSLDSLLQEFSKVQTADRAANLYKQNNKLDGFMKVLKRIWKSFLNKNALLSKLGTTANPSDSKKVGDVIVESKGLLALIENTIAAAALRKYRTVKLLLVQYESLVSSGYKEHLISLWDRICAELELRKQKRRKTEDNKLFAAISAQLLERKDPSKFKFRYEYVEKMLTDNVMKKLEQRKINVQKARRKEQKLISKFETKKSKPRPTKKSATKRSNIAVKIKTQAKTSPVNIPKISKPIIPTRRPAQAIQLPPQVVAAQRQTSFSRQSPSLPPSRPQKPQISAPSKVVQRPSRTPTRRKLSMWMNSKHSGGQDMITGDHTEICVSRTMECDPCLGLQDVGFLP